MLDTLFLLYPSHIATGLLPLASEMLYRMKNRSTSVRIKLNNPVDRHLHSAGDRVWFQLKVFKIIGLQIARAKWSNVIYFRFDIGSGAKFLYFPTHLSTMAQQKGLDAWHKWYWWRHGEFFSNFDTFTHHALVRILLCCQLYAVKKPHCLITRLLLQFLFTFLSHFQ